MQAEHPAIKNAAYVKFRAMDKQLFEQLRKFRGSRTLIVGIGNILKADEMKRELCAVVYGADQIDAQGDYTDSDELYQAMMMEYTPPMHR